MPAKSQKQLKLIFAIRNKYKSESKTPQKWKWVWGEEWAHLTKESHILDFQNFSQLEAISQFEEKVPMVDLELIEDFLIELSDKWNLSHDTHDNYNGYISIKAVKKGNSGSIIDLGIQLNSNFDKSKKSQFEDDLFRIIKRLESVGFKLDREVNCSHFSSFITYHISLLPRQITNEANKNLESRAHLDECWYKAKVGDVIPEDHIFNYVQYLHDDYEGAFIEGDLGDRIEEYGSYKLMEIPLSEIDLEEFDLDDWAVGEYKDKIKETGTYPPIVLDDKQHNQYTIIDGTHRANAVKN